MEDDIATLGVRVVETGVEETNRKLDTLKTRGKGVQDSLTDAERSAQKFGNVIGTELRRGVENSTASLGALGRVMMGLGPAGMAAAAAIGAVVGVLAVGIREFAQYELASVALEGTLRRVGNISGMTADELREFASSIESASLITEEKVLEIEAVFLRLGITAGKQFRDVTQLSVDLAAVMGTDPVQAAQALGRAIEDPIDGLSQLRRSFKELDEGTIAAVQALARAGDETGAVTLLIERLQEKIGGSAATQADTLYGAWLRATDAAGDFARSAAEVTGATSAARSVLEGATTVLNSWTGAMTGSKGPTESMTKSLQFMGVAYLTLTGRIVEAIAAQNHFNELNKRASGNTDGGGMFGVQSSEKMLAGFAQWSAQARKTLEAQEAGKRLTKEYTDELEKQSGVASRAAKDRAVQAAGDEAVAKVTQQALRDGINLKNVDLGLIRRMAEENKRAEQARDESDRAAARGSGRRQKEINEQQRLNVDLEKYITDLEAEASLIGLSSTEREVRRALLEAEGQLLDRNGNKIRELTEIEKGRIRKSVEAQEFARYNQEVERYIESLDDENELIGLNNTEREVRQAILEAENKLLDDQGKKIRELTELEKNQIRASIEERKRLNDAMEESQAWNELFVDGLRGLSQVRSLEDLEQWFIRLIERVIELIIEIKILKPLIESLGGGGGGFDFGLGSVLGGGDSFLDAGTPIDPGVVLAGRGKVFQAGQVTPMSRGHMVARRTIMPLAEMGEDGEEAVMPLTRINGVLGVRMVGGGSAKGEARETPVIFQVVDQRKSGTVEQQEDRGPNGERVLRAIIRDEMKRGMGEGAFDKDFERNFGTRRKPVTR